MNPYLLHGEELARTEKARRDHSTSVSSGSASALNPKAAWPFPQTREELLAERDQLRERVKKLEEALNLVPALRPLLLKEMGYVPESVLNITNAARTVLAKIT